VTFSALAGMFALGTAYAFTAAPTREAAPELLAQATPQKDKAAAPKATSPKAANPKTAAPNNSADPHGATQAPPLAFMNGMPEKAGYLTWRQLADVKVKRQKDRMVPTFSGDLNKLNNREVKIEGFMIPLDPTTPREQKHFVLTALPQSCSFCLPPVGMEGIVEVKTNKPVPVTIEPVRLSGKLSVMTDDPMGLYYRLTETTQLK
jgi:uncharacterized protein